MATKDKPNNKNLKALFSVICLCIVALGLIVYFSTQSSNTTDVNEATTVVETTKAKTTVKASETTTFPTTAAKQKSKRLKKRIKTRQQP